MRNLKRVLTIALASVTLAAAMAVGTAAAGTKFTDVSAKDETLYKAVTLLEGMGITQGTSDTTFGTNEDVTREQMAAFIYRLMKGGKTLEGGENNTPFEDLYDDTYYGMISWANNMNIIKGVSATEFDPDGGITLQDAYTMLVRALGYEKNEILSYPHSYINIAEQKDVELGEGLPSKVSYTTELTRGNVAVLLYNAFYAETATPETVQKERKIGSGDNAKWVLETVEEYPRLCEKVYDVIEENFTVVETTHYAFNSSEDSNEYKATEDSAGEGTLFLVSTEKDQKVSGFYTTVGELGLDGKADSYIMSELTVYYTYDEDDKTVDEILFAESHMDKQTANTASYGSVTADRVLGDSEHYYSPSGPDWLKMDGSMVVAGKKLYFFDAPYNFVAPSYTGCTTEDERYAVRNEDNTKLINLKCLDTDKGLYSYYLVNKSFQSKDADHALAKYFSQVRTSGIYKMDIFDPDGDGRYEYMWYKPASFAQIDMDEDYTFADTDGIIKEKADTTDPNALTTVPKLYANGANLTGVAFNNEDFVIAYVNADANMIDIIGVAQGKKGIITAFNEPTGTLKIGNQEFRTCYQFLFVEDYFQYDSATATQSSGSANTSVFSFLRKGACLGTEVILYTYNHNYNNIFYYEIVSSSSEYAGENLIIPIEAETERVRDEATFEEKQYLKVLMGGEETYISVDVDECYPAPTRTSSGTYLFDNVVTDENGKKYDVYLNKLCTYKVDSKGNYTISSLFHGKDSDGDYDHIDLVFDSKKFFSEKKTYQAGNDLGVKKADEAVTLKKLSGRYSILDANDSDYSMLGTYGESVGGDYWFKDANVTADTVFIIRVLTDDDEDGEYESEIITYTGLTFPGTTESTLSNVQYVYENDGTSKNRVNLVLFYGESYGDVEYETGIDKNGYRVIKAMSPVKVADKEYRYSYDLLNLSTGAVEEGVLGTKENTKAGDLTTERYVGEIIELNKNGQVDDKAAKGDQIEVDANTKLVKIIATSVEDMFIEATPIRTADEKYFSDAKTGELYEIYEFDDDVTVTLIKFGEKGDYETVEISAIDVETLAKAGKDILCYNSKYLDKKDKLTLEYAEYVKAYIVFDKKSRDEFPTVENIVVIVNDGESSDLLSVNNK